MLISVIIPVYNAEKTIETCVDSILTQNFDDYELLLVDDGSTDKSSDICMNYSLINNHVRYFKRENKGPSEARIFGVNNAIGDYVVFVDADDWSVGNSLEIIKNNISDCDLMMFSIEANNNKGMLKVIKGAYEPGLYEGEKLEYIKRNFLYREEDGMMLPVLPNLWNKAYRREKVKVAFEKLNTKIRIYEDMILNSAYIPACNKVIIVDEVLYHYSYTEGSLARRINENALSDYNDIYHNVKKIFSEFDMENKLIRQLQWWMIATTIRVYDGRIGFEDDIRPTRYVADLDGFRNKKIALYGAGRVGREYYKQLKAFEYNVVIWCDKNADNLGENIYPPEELLKTEYDIVLVSVLYSDIADEIILELKKLGIDESKIVFRKAYEIV